MPRYALGSPDTGGINLFYVLDHDTDSAAQTKALAWLTEAFPDQAIADQSGHGGLPDTGSDAAIRNLLLRVADDLALDASFLPAGMNDNAVAEFTVRSSVD